MTFKLYYFLEDDTIAIRELKENREGRDYFPMYLKRTKLRKNEETVSSNLIGKKKIISDLTSLLTFSFTIKVLSFLAKAEYNEIDPSEFYSPIDLRVGSTIFIVGRRFLLTDCDLSTRRYYADVLKSPQPDKVFMKESRTPRPHTVTK